jgi:hypothetical protein
MLQAESRSIVYGDRDPWNQTAADNPEWLRMFKQGIESPLPLSAIYSDLSVEGQRNILGRTSGTSWRWLNPECLADFRQHHVDAAHGPPDI